ncbi:MAG: polymer-forming cytoskeletal protein [Verrucomicrobiales bacterium]|nr:polymer-forming cytoskeletal protein [Verrucomicrobiales bacterium]
MALKQIINQSSPSDMNPLESSPAPTSEHTPSPRLPAGNMSKNILSSDVEIKGTLKFSNDLIIDGKIDGEVSSDGDLTVGENARIKGDITTRSVIVFGKVTGNITVNDRCELKQNAELVGDIKAGKLAIEEGATFMGSSSVGAAATAKDKGSAFSSSSSSDSKSSSNS